MPELQFPEGFLWGAATAAHQVEGNNVHSDWWAWENMPDSPVREPSGTACEHYTRYPADVRLLGDLGLTAYRFSVEWARVEPAPGVIEGRELDHYRGMVEQVREAGLTPVVTLNHFTLPAWLGRRGGWLGPDAPERFAGYCSRVVERLGDLVEWYATLNEAGIVAFGGYLGALRFPPGRRSLATWEQANRALVRAHTLARDAVRGANPRARVGQTVSMVEWTADAGGDPVVGYLRRMLEDAFLQSSAGDDWVGVQAYTRQAVRLPAALGPVLRGIVGSGTARRAVVPPALRAVTRSFGTQPAGHGPDGVRRTLMGYEFWPESIGATLRRAAALLPGKPLMVTEHGVATRDDTERVEYIARGLTAVHACITAGIPVLGYLHWSALDNFESGPRVRPHLRVDRSGPCDAAADGPPLRPVPRRDRPNRPGPGRRSHRLGGGRSVTVALGGGSCASGRALRMGRGGAPVDRTQVADELYGLLPGEFTRARDACADEASARGDRELAAWIKQLRKPRMSAWALNLSVRRHPEEIGQLIALGARMREAQARLSGPELQQLGRQRREALATVGRLVRDVAAELGHPLSDAAESEVQETLHSALADPSAAHTLRTGRMSAPLSYTGLGALGSAAGALDGVGAGTVGAEPRRAAAPGKSRRSAAVALTPVPGGRAPEVDRRQRDLDRAGTAVREAEHDALGAAAALGDAEARLERATSRRQDLDERVLRLTEQLRQLEDQAMHAGREVRDARHARDFASRVDQAAQASLRRARAELEALER